MTLRDAMRLTLTPEEVPLQLRALGAEATDPSPLPPDYPVPGEGLESWASAGFVIAAVLLLLWED
jgi:hypothetical protein